MALPMVAILYLAQLLALVEDTGVAETHQYRLEIAVVLGVVEQVFPEEIQEALVILLLCLQRQHKEQMVELGFLPQR